MSTIRKFLHLVLAATLSVLGGGLMADPQIWQIGVDDPAGPGGANEFSPENSANNAGPGLVTRISGDPLYNSGTNPAADDDFYFSGSYPIGFNGLGAILTVPNNEPSVAWEHSLTKSDLTNRFHFILNSSQISAGSMIRLSFEFYTGGKVVSGVNQGFGEHDILVRFKNASGTGTQLYASTITTITNILVIIPTANVAASAGPNTIEIIRTGPLTAGISYWATFDYVRLEVDAGGNASPVPVAVPTQTIPEMAAFAMNLSTTDLDTPNAEMLYERLSGPTGLAVSPSGVVSWTPGEDQGPSTNVVSVRVTDAGIPRKSATNTFTVVVTEVNRPPTTTFVSTQTINELTPYAVTVLSADPDLPANNRTFAKISGPDGLTVSPSGQVAWTPSEGQGPVTATVSVRVSDDGVPPLFATNNFTVIVREVNTPPIPTVFPQQNLDEGVPFTLDLTSTDGDLPPQTLTHTRLSGPTGLLVSSTGILTWTPTEGQGPITTNAVVRITDNGSPALMSTNVISLNVREVNLAPTFAALPIQYVDELSPLDLNLTATDPDVPANALTFSRVDGPTGLTVSTQGRVLWTPLPSQIPQTYTVTVRVDDNGVPSQFATLNFTVITRAATPRYVWQIGLETTPPSIGDLGAPNGLNDLAPGKVTRIAGDPQYDAATNPTPDDDFYFSGIYRAGFNNLPSLITVPNDEPATAWEYSLTHGDRTNRMHFLLSQSQLVPASRLRLSFEFPYGGHILAGVNQGFGSHDVVVRFRNGNGVATDIYATTFTQASNVTFLINPVTVQATLGANSIEFVRTGPIVSGYTYYFHFDYVRLEADPSGNLAPLPVAVSTQTIDELVPYTRTLQTTDGDVPAQSFTYERISGPSGLLVSPGGVVTWTPSEAQGPSTNVISVRVTDSGSPPKSATNTFTIVVREVNSSPVPVALASQNIGEMAPWSLTLQSNDSDIPVNLLAYEKISGPANLNVSSAGVITWTPTELDGPGSYPLSVRVTDDGDPALNATHSFTVNVGEVNRPPILSALATQSVTENVALSFQVPGSDPDLPANSVTFELVSGPPNLSVSPSGVLSWTPTEPQGPASYNVAVSITDNGQPFLSTTNSYTISVLESNSPPVWNAISDQTVAELTALNVTLSALDPDIPPTAIVYSLVSGPNGMDVATDGLLTWTPSEIQGPSTNVVLVRATDSGSPALSATNTFTVTVLEGNSAPTSPVIPETAFDELTPLSLSVIGEDTDDPTNQLVFELIDGPSNLTVTAEGVVQWTPTELEGPSTNVVSVRVQDNGDPALSTTNTFTLVVREVNTAPVMDPIADQAADQLTPLSLSLSANDADLPANSLTYGLVSGPVGLTVSSEGLVEWLPLPAYNDSTNIVLVRVTDNGSPQKSTTNEFTVVVANPDTRLVFAIGVNDDPLILPYDPEAELGNSNGTIDLAPGVVTRLESDPEYSAESNPTADDHYYFSGVYPSGYNGNTATLTVAEDEPFSAWERELTTDDPSNRFHFILNSAQIGLSSRLLLTVGLVSGGFSLEGVPQEGFGSHEVLIRFHNGLGVSTDIHSATVTEDAELVVDFAVTDVAATLGANSIEILRTGPSSAGTLHRLGFDFVHLESTAPANTPPLLGSLPETTLDELTPMVLNLSALDGETPPAQLLYSKISGPDGLLVSASGQVTWTPGEADGPSSYVFAIRVTDDGVPSLSATNEFAVTVYEVNSAPALSSLPTQSIDEGSLLNVFLTANDSDLPANGLLFEMISGPNGATVDSNGLMLWQTDESTGPVTDVIMVRVSDDGTPPLKTTNSFTINVREINQTPVFDAIANQNVDEMTLLALTLTGEDPDIPANALTFALVSGPGGMNVTTGGSLTWTPSESQGPSNHVVQVSLTDAGIPSRSVTNQFTVTVNEVNRPPQLAAVATQNITGTTSLNLNLSATDPDAPANTLTFSAVQVPPGLTVSAAGAVTWTPGTAQTPSANVVKVRVTDNGVPALSHTNQFTVNVSGTAPRFIWMIGTNNNTFGEFGQENSINDLPPGNVTRLVGDPLYNSTANPGRDDDWYSAGTYSSGFNGLTSTLVVPNDEPWTSFERTLVTNDRTNRFHFILAASQVSPNSVLRLTVRHHSAGSQLGGFGTHDIVIRFKNASGATTQLYANQLTAAGTALVQFSASSVAASAGPNTIEFVRNGVNITGNIQWINFDYVLLEVDGGGNLPPAFPNLDPIEVDEGNTLAIDLSARDSDTPPSQLVHTLLSGPAGATLTSGGQFSWVTTEAHGGTTSLVRVKVTDNGIPALSTTNDFSVFVREVNRTPVIAAVSSFRIDTLSPLALQLGGSDPDLPADGLFYDKVSGPDDLIVTASGQVLWTPAGTDIPSTNTVTVRITDDGSPALSATTQFTVIAQAAVDRNVWLIGEDDSPLSNPYLPVDEFGTPTSNGVNDVRPGKVTRLPADPQYVSPTPTQDDDYYFAGIYPPGFNGLTSHLIVPFDEPTTSWEAALTQSDRTNRMHFRLNGEQINDSGHLRLSFEFSSVTATTNGVAVAGSFPHTIVVQFKSGLGQPTLLYSNVLTQPTRVTLEIPATNVVATLGANTIEFVRTGPTFAGTTQTVMFDYVRLDADSQGNLDEDGDGLPKNWEIDNHLSDSDPSDALQDLDHDGLSAIEEYNGGTNSSNPRMMDSDADGLLDGEERTAGSNPLVADTDLDGVSDYDEVHGTPATSPLLADSDFDGVSDLLERTYGSDPNNASQKPTRFRGGIAINFVSNYDLLGILGTNGLAGVVPQTTWNETVALGVVSKPSGGTADITTPLAGQIVRSDGTNLPNVKIKWTSNSTFATHNSGSGDQVLMNGFLRASSGVPVSLTVSNVPFASYDVYVYVGAAFDSQQGVVRLGTDPATDRFFQARSTAPQTEWLEVLPGAAKDRPANYVRYSNLTSADFTVTLTSLLGQTLGIHAIQIVDRLLDNDLSGIPDWWELRYALEPGTTALAAADTDSDGLSNLQEYQRGSDPRNPDTDVDGLLDGQETAANSLRYDSDNDGISDEAEKGSIYITNPNSGDSDGDGVGDWLERFYFSDPTYNESSSPTFVGWTPKYSAATTSWEWNLENIQLVWDHGAGALYPDEFNDNDLVAFSVRNSTLADSRSFSMNLRYYKGLLSYYFYSHPGGGMSSPTSAGSTLTDAPTGGKVKDLTPDLGFSGYGATDVSDRLQLRMLATRGTGNSWTLSFELRNQTRNISLVKRTFLNCTAPPSVDAGTATWINSAGASGRITAEVPRGVQLFFSPTPLENRPQFAATRDTDNDGVPDVWENAHGMNYQLASDALKDLDDDGLNGRDEYLLGTDPIRPDSDGDGIPDGVERANGSNPAEAISVPQYTQFPALAGEDLNGDGLPDAWQIHYHGFGLTLNGDPDGDGQSNAQEALWGTNPFDNASKIALTLEAVSPDIILSWPHQDFKKQTLLWKTGDDPWVAYSGQPWTDGGISWLALSNRVALAPTEFYRVDTMDRDSDGDGVTDWAENILGTDPERNNSSRSPVRIVAADGTVTGSIAGDYATFVDTVRTGSSFGAHQMSRLQAARFLQQASFGPTPSELDRVQELGFAGWIDDQIANRPPSLHSPYIEEIVRDYYGPRNYIDTYRANTNINVVQANNVNTSFARAAIGGSDQLRQRVAFALSQILVISRRNVDIQDNPQAITSYYDIFVRNAFSNYFNILREVTLHPAMGMYLSAIGNQKAIPEINQYPDENYAREVQQLFSIGLWELNQDGSQTLNSIGDPILTYGNKEITEFARVFTGFWFGGQSWGIGGVGGFQDNDSIVPMELWVDKHDFGEKTLLRGFKIPARSPSVQNGLKDVDDALRSLLDHPNTAPFIGKQLIQFLVTSNPSSNYVARISAVFANDGAGERGNLGAVIKAILLDPEARDPQWSATGEEYGRLKEPVYRAINLARVGNLGRHPGLLWWTVGVAEFYAAGLQEPTLAPTVFNFYRPNYQPPGIMAQRNLVGPVFQITDSYTSISFPNKLWEITEKGFITTRYAFAPDYTELMRLADDAEALLDEVNLLFCGGGMSASTRRNVLEALEQVAPYDRILRAQLAVYLAVSCPDGAVQR